MIGIGQPHEQVPPVEEQCDEARHQAATLEIAGREAAPAPLILQRVEDVPTIGAVAIELADGKNLAVERGHQNGVFPDLAAIIEDGIIAAFNGGTRGGDGNRRLASRAGATLFSSPVTH
jgi:hypothetical protein